MKILLIIAHPNKDSLNFAIAKCCLATLEANGHTVFFHDLITAT
ncbi:NAD(P)H-dependent oxidoreductase [Desulfosarcina variabilis]